MNFRLSSYHDRIPHASKFLHSGTLLEYPDQLKVALNCDAPTFQRGLMHTELHPLVETDVYARYAGMCIFYHHEMNKTCSFHFTTQHVRVKDTTACVTEVYDLKWENEQDFVTYLGCLECKLKLHTVSWRFFVKDDVEYVAVPHADLERMTTYVRQRLTALSVKFQHTVSFGNTTHRCILFPSSLINTRPLPPHLDTRLWAICSVFPSPVVYAMSKAQTEEFGVRFGPNTPLGDVICTMHPAEEQVHICTTVLPKIHALEDHDEIQVGLEFDTPTTKGQYTAFVVKVRTCFLIVFTRVPPNTPESTGSV